jgi:5'-3' exoribonuclease 1
MGIPYYFKFLFDTYPNIVYHILDKCNIPIDNYLVDLNALIHPCCQKFFPKPNESNKFDNKPKRLLHSKNIETKRPIISNKMIYSELCKEIEKRVFIVRPKKRIYIAIDGIPGCAKGSQQRQRRFLSVKSKTEEEIKEFDTNGISVGTDFMDGLSRYLDYFFKGKVEKNSYWKNLEIIFSNDKHEGEGEHKLKLWILSNFQELLKNKETVCIDSPDADVLMLSMSTHYPYLYIFRDNMYKNITCKHFLVDIGKLRTALIETINNNDLKEKDEKESDDGRNNNNDLITDFLFISFFFGNDFFHGIRCLEMNKNNMDDLLRLYFEARMISNKRIVNSETLTINTHFFKIFLSLLAKNECEFFKNKSKFGYVDPLIQKYSDDRGDIDLSKYRDEYYKTKLFISSKEEKDQYCSQYFKALTFVLRYYMKEMPDWLYSFKYHYSPFFTDLYDYIKTVVDPIIDYKFLKNKPLSLFEQLVSILPPESKNLIPKQLHSLYHSNSEIIDFFPVNFNVDLEGKKEEYLGTVCLPFVDSKRLKDAYNKIDLSGLTEFERKRNFFGKIMIYRNVDGKVVRSLL